MEAIRVFFITFSPLRPFKAVEDSKQIGCSWVDSLLAALKADGRFEIAIAFPTLSDTVVSKDIDGIKYTGLPFLEQKTFFRKVGDKLCHAAEPESMNNYAIKAIEEFKPSVVQVFGSENPFGLVAGRISVPTILHIQGIINVWEQKWFTALSGHEQKKYTPFIDRLTLKRNLYYEYKVFKNRAVREREILKQCRYFMGRTDFDRRTLWPFNPEAQYFHCEELIRKEFFNHKWNRSLGKTIRCISIIKGTSYKGLDLLIKTAKIIRENDLPYVQFDVCGISPDEEIPGIFAKKFNISYNDLGIKLKGRLNASELIDSMCEADIYVHPSYIENSPNSICEAMALGMPVIATNTGGCENLVKNGEEGVLIQEGEPYSLAGAIMEMAKDPEKAAAMGRKAAKSAAIRHNPQATVDNLYNIYKTIISENER